MMEFVDERTIWLTRSEAAEMLKCSKGKVDHIIREMKDLDMDGIFEDEHFLRLNQQVLNEYVFKRRKLKNDSKRGRNNH